MQTGYQIAHAGSRLKPTDCLERHRLESQPSSRTGENPPYGMIGRIEETSASYEARSAPRSYPTVGLTPQAINTIGSFRAQGRDQDDWAPIEADARAVADAGAFSVVLEAMAEPLARRITAEVGIPTIGIGASVARDGEILVLEAMLGLWPRVPKFVKRFGD